MLCQNNRLQRDELLLEFFIWCCSISQRIILVCAPEFEHNSAFWVIWCTGWPLIHIHRVSLFDDDVTGWPLIHIHRVSLFDGDVCVCVAFACVEILRKPISAPVFSSPCVSSLSLWTLMSIAALRYPLPDQLPSSHIVSASNDWTVET